MKISMTTNDWLDLLRENAAALRANGPWTYAVFDYPGVDPWQSPSIRNAAGQCPLCALATVVKPSITRTITWVWALQEAFGDLPGPDKGGAGKIADAADRPFGAGSEAERVEHDALRLALIDLLGVK
jgi:hypothetical protein